MSSRPDRAQNGDTPGRQTVRHAFGRVIRTGIAWQVLLLVFLSLAVRYWLHTQHDLGHTIRSLGLLAPLFTVALQCATSMTPVGSSVIPTLNGMLFPLPLAMILNVLSGLLTGIVMYYLWRHGEREIQLQRRLGSLPRWARRFARTDLISLVVLRQLPWAGANVANLLAGSHGVPLRTHVASILIGSIPGAVIYALLGARIVTL